MTHSAGPWAVKHLSLHQWEINSGSYPYAKVGPLLAEAPQLLATLKWIAQEIRWEHDMTASLTVAEQAIAKATGAE